MTNARDETLPVDVGAVDVEDGASARSLMSLPRVVERALGRVTRERPPFTLLMHPATRELIAESEVAYVLNARVLYDSTIEVGVVYSFGGGAAWRRHDLRGG